MKIPQATVFVTRVDLENWHTGPAPTYVNRVPVVIEPKYHEPEPTAFGNIFDPPHLLAVTITPLDRRVSTVPPIDLIRQETVNGAIYYTLETQQNQARGLIDARTPLDVDVWRRVDG